MSKIKEKEKALKLRRGGNSISDIATLLKVSKSTVSYWCRDVSLSIKAQETIAKRSKSKSTFAILRYTESLRAKRRINTLKDMTLGAEHLGSLTSRDIYCLGLGLYWGEGYKKGSQEFGFTNSDPAMIKFYLLWLKEVFKVQRSDLILRVSINSMHQGRIDLVQDYWSAVTQVPLGQFTKASLIKSQSRKIYANLNEHYGTLRVKVRKGTRMRRQVLGAIESILVKHC
ncbi:MAG: helix-turn-helix domain-containing protein [Candidatus Paceibacterota bacterium]